MSVRCEVSTALAMAALNVIIVALAVVCSAHAQLPSFSLPAILDQMTQARNLLSTTVSDGTNFLQGHINATGKLMTSTLATSQNQIDTIVNTAMDAAKSQSGVNSCSTAKMGEVQGLGLQTALNSAKCVTDKVEQFKKLLDNVINLGQETTVFLPKSLGQIQTCSQATGFFQPALCYTGESMNLMNQVGRITGGVAFAVATGHSLVSNLQNDLSLCLSSKLGVLAAQATATAGTFAECALKSIG